MARKKRSSRFDGRWVIFLIVSLMIVLAMILPSIMAMK
jgi:hypothetical protein